MNNLFTELTSSALFNLETFQHARIFDECLYVWEAISNISSYLKELNLGSIKTKIPDGAILIDAHLISIDEGTVIEPGSYIKGPCFIGKNCTIRQGAYIRGDLITGNGCVIGHDTEIKNSLLLDRAHAAHFAYLGDSILGNGVNLGAGVKCANLKLDGKEVKVSFNEQMLSTGLRKFGAICGDDVQLGCNAVSNPGTIVGKGCKCYPCVNFGGYIPPFSIIKSNASVSITSSKQFQKES